MSREPRIQILGVETDPFSVHAAAAVVVDRAVRKTGGYACLCNVHVLVAAHGKNDVTDALACASLVFADGAPLAWIQRALGATAERVSGAELFERIVEVGRAQRVRHVIFGGAPEAAEAAARALRRRYPGADITTIVPPMGNLDALNGVWIRRLRDSNAAVIWCALGAPKQELWMRRHAADLSPAFVVGIGAAIDFVAGSKTRAPKWMQHAGLEWVHRLAMEPRRLLGRYVYGNARFVLLLVLNIRRLASQRAPRRSHGGAAS
jgi:N-acetylglucosaminyldiphosphoundecaprenol N-acetyl-beta-D-mannosaminyltransferase